MRETQKTKLKRMGQFSDPTNNASTNPPALDGNLSSETRHSKPELLLPRKGWKPAGCHLPHIDRKYRVLEGGHVPASDRPGGLQLANFLVLLRMKWGCYSWKKRRRNRKKVRGRRRLTVDNWIHPLTTAESATQNKQGSQIGRKPLWRCIYRKGLRLS